MLAQEEPHGPGRLLSQRGLLCLVPAVQHPLQKTPLKPEQDASKEHVTQQHKGAGAQFHLLFTSRLNPEGVEHTGLFATPQALPVLTSGQDQALLR